MAEVPAGTANAVHARRVFLVDRGFQLKYALLMAGAGALVALIFGLWLHQAHAQALEVAGIDPDLREVLARGDRQLLVAFAGIAALLALALGLLGVVMTHRVAGPVAVIGHYVAVLARGAFPRMRTLRKTDELRAFFQIFIDAVGQLKAREVRHVELLEETLAAMKGALPRAPELEAAIAPLEEAVRERRAAVRADDPEPTPMYVARPGGGHAVPENR
ncbi:MAG TPA: hypothetical protein VLT47_06270 [Anaeromyxobacteraceae bacterium]|nr:hypothetical protein [Anaeromyxobacteraceae bacterium]